VAVTTSDGEHFENEFDMLHQQIFKPAEDKLDYTNKFNTPLTSEEQKTFNQKYGENPRDLYDYDLQGFHKANPDFDREAGQHLTDQFKKPNHPTFSEQSQYSGGEFQGGRWSTLGEDRFGFTPGRTNLEMHGMQNLQDYFKKVEPGNVLNPSEPKQIYFVRHGEPHAIGWAQDSLNESGRADAKRAAESAKDLPVEHVISSDLPRAAETGRIIANKNNLPIEYDPGLRTWNLGKLNGPPNEEKEKEINRLCTTAHDEVPEGGESFNQFSHRILSTMSNIIQRHPDKELMIVSHSSPGKVLNAWTEAGQPGRSENA
jgi:broad specificity phosphatase PhoE